MQKARGMKNVILAMYMLLVILASLAPAQAGPAYETPPGWTMRVAGDGSLIFTPGDLKAGETAYIQLSPVIDVLDDPQATFERLLRVSLRDDETTVSQGDVQIVTVGRYRIISRLVVVARPDGSRLGRVCSLEAVDGKGQFGMFVVNSSELFNRYTPAVDRFAESWDFAQIGRGPVVLAPSPTPAASASSPRVDPLVAAKLTERVGRCVDLQAKLKFGEALAEWRALDKTLEAFPRSSGAAPGSDEAFWQGQLRFARTQLALNMPGCLLNQGKFEEAMKSAQRWLATAGDDWKVAASSYATMGAAHFYLLEYDKARAILNQARKSLEQRFLQAAAAVEASMDRIKGAQVSPIDAEQISAAFQVFTESRSLYSKIFSLLVQLGLYEDAVNLYTSPSFVRLSGILARPEFRVGFAASCDRLGAEYAAQLLPAFDKMLALERLERSSSLFTAWRLKAVDAGAAGDLEKAAALLEEQKALVGSQPPDAFRRVSMQANTGTLLMATKKWAEARKAFQDALVEARAVPEQLYRDSARQMILMRLAEACVELGDGPAARAAIDEMKTLDVQVDPTVLPSLYWTRARVETLVGDQAAAMADFNRCLDILERERAGVQSAELLKTFYRHRQRMYEDAIHFLQQRHDPLNALDIMEKVRARTLRDMLEKTPIAKGATPELLARFAAIREEERQKQIAENRAYLASAGPTLRGVLTASSQTEQRSLDELLSTRPELAELKTGTPPSKVAAKVKLDVDTVALCYFFGERHSAVVVLDAGGRGRICEVPVTASDLREMVADLRGSVQAASGEDYPLDADRLYKVLIEPVQQDLVGKRRLVIVPYGASNYLPWAVLGPRGGKALLEDHEVVLLPSLSVLGFCTARNTHALKSGMAFAIGGLSRADMAPLPGTRAEVDAIAGVMPTMQVAAEEAFTFESILRKGGSSDILHFATHGFVDAAQPDRSGILTADGKLFLSEIFRLDLHANLIVLSACDTGLGKVYNGDEMVGLTRAFMYAGTPSVVATLWKVSDKATARFMTLFYESLARGRDKAAALHDAQVALRKEFSHPLYWAPFTLYGDWR